MSPDVLVITVVVATFGVNVVFAVAIFSKKITI